MEEEEIKALQKFLDALDDEELREGIEELAVLVGMNEKTLFDADLYPEALQVKRMGREFLDAASDLAAGVERLIDAARGR